MLKLWIQSRVDLHRKSTPDPILKHLCNSKHSQPSIKLQRVWILQSLNTLDSAVNFTPNWFKKTTYKNVYSPIVYLVNDQHFDALRPPKKRLCEGPKKKRRLKR